MLEPEKTQHRANTGLFFPPIGTKIAGPPQAARPEVSEMKIGAAAQTIIG